ncbi:MAG: aminodeoxychorismate synthase component I [Thermogutta sp.]
MGQSLPLVAEISYSDWPRSLLVFCHLPGTVYLDSALSDCRLGRYSFLAADPFQSWVVPSDAPSHLAREVFCEIAATTRLYRQSCRPDLPPFQGGAAGLWSYELNRAFEDVPAASMDDLRTPLLSVGLYDVVLAVDHERQAAWLISQGFPEIEYARRIRRARERLDFFFQRFTLANEPSETPAFGKADSPSRLSGQFRVQPPVERDLLPLWSNFSEDAYLAAVSRVIEYIRAGDVFQVNLSQRLAIPAVETPLSFYQRLRTLNPAPFAGYCDLGEWQILSASPERFLQVRDRKVETRPIKGTRPRTHNPEEDERSYRQLLESEKDRAENVMITDLLRNDLSRVCSPESVRVSSLCHVETYETVFHLVSVVEGHLRESCDAFDLLGACFPGGSITGAPKIRAMEIIAELEPHVRGAYCGSLGYVGFSGDADFNILIRTLTARNGWWVFSVGGGILATSRPKDEHAETWHKAEGLLHAIRAAYRLST